MWLLLVDTLGLFVRYSIRHEYDAAIAARSRRRRGAGATVDRPGRTAAHEPIPAASPAGWGRSEQVPGPSARRAA